MNAKLLWRKGPKKSYNNTQLPPLVAAPMKIMKLAALLLFYGDHRM